MQRHPSRIPHASRARARFSKHTSMDEPESLPGTSPPLPSSSPGDLRETSLVSKHSSTRHFFAGAIGGSCSAIILNPLDIVRTRLQSAGSVKLRPDLLIKHIYHTEGLLAFYRGIVPTILGVGPSRAMYFGFFRSLKSHLASTADGAPGLSGGALHLSSAALAGLATNTLMSPWWVIRLRLQLQSTPVVPIWVRARDAWRGWREGMQSQRTRALASSLAGAGPAFAADGAHATPSLTRSSHLPPHAPKPPPPIPGQGYKGVVDAAARILREEGFRTFYRGLAASYLGVLETALQFALYGIVKDAMIERRFDAARAELLRDSPGLDPSSITRSDVVRQAYTPWHAFWNSGATKLLASVATYPHEVIRTRMREQRSDCIRYTGIVNAVLTIGREEGLKGLYGGMSVHLLRTVPNTVILMLVVENLVGGEV